jgi:hypothetical protein
MFRQRDVATGATQPKRDQVAYRLLVLNDQDACVRHT